MEREAALDELPVAYATALRLREVGVDPSVIAAGLGIEMEAVASLLEIADRDLQRVLRGGERG